MSAGLWTRREGFLEGDGAEKFRSRRISQPQAAVVLSSPRRNVRRRAGGRPRLVTIVSYFNLL